MIALGLLLRGPALDASLMSDDWDHYAMTSGMYPLPRAAWDFFDFVSSDPSERRALLDSGRLPWWSDPELQLSFLRPLSSVSLWADHALADRHHVAALAHWHSAAWWALGAAAVAAVLLQLLPSGMALLGTLLYVVDDAHALPLTWAASRSELIAVALMTWALLAQLLWKKRQLARYRVAALVLIALGMLSGEHAVALSAFLVASELGEPGTPLRTRLLRALPLFVPVALYVGVRSLLGYGAAGSMFYVDPIGEPIAFLRALATRVPVLVGDLALGYPADYWYWLPPWSESLARLHLLPDALLTHAVLKQAQWWCGFAALSCVGLAWLRLGKRATSDPARALCWLLGGAVLALLPLSAAIPMTRLTVGPSIAFHAAFAWLVVQAWTRMREPVLVRRLGAALLIALLLGVHGGLAAARSRSLVEHYAYRSRIDARWLMRARLGDGTLSKRHLIVVGANDPATAFSLPYVRHFGGRSVPLTSDVLLPPFGERLGIARIGPNAFEAFVGERGFSDFRSSAYRRAELDFTVGQQIVGPRFTVVVLGTANGVPTRLRFVFARPLEDPSWTFAYATANGLQAFRLPRLGQTVALPPPAFPGQL